MRKLGLVMLVAVAGCGSSSGGKVNPASVDACLSWANGICRLAYLCVDASSQDAAFHALYGTSSDTCFQTLNARCNSNQAAGHSFGPSCGPGKTVNPTALMTCTDAIDTESCVDWMAAPSGGCENICGTASTSPDGGTGGRGGSGSGTGGSGSGGSGAGSGGTSGGGGSGGSGSVATETDFCSTWGNEICVRQFDCDPTNAAASFGTVAGCQGFIALSCAQTGSTSCPNGYNASLAPACIADTQSATCAVILGSTAPASCTAACMQ